MELEQKFEREIHRLQYCDARRDNTPLTMEELAIKISQLEVDENAKKAMLDRYS